jgi:methyl-accepting chemotaxis protein
MARGLSAYAERVERQDAMIASSSASIEKVIGSIDAISGIAEADRAAADGLVKATAESRVVFGETFEGLSDIARSVEGINEMAQVIQEIASRTNLLAMNAAIEAAHAGESGKGFSVVADEIRKLASAASDSSKQIGQTIRSVGERMSGAESSRDNASASFEVMDAQIGTVTSSASKIDGHLVEIREKARAVLLSMRELRDTSKSSVDDSAEIVTAASSVDGTMTEAARVSQEVRSNIAEIAAGLDEIASSVREVATLSDQLGEAGSRLDSAVNTFTTS